MQMLLARSGRRALNGAVLGAAVAVGIAGTGAHAESFAVPASPPQAQGYALVQSKEKTEDAKPRARTRSKTRRVTPCGPGASVEDGCLRENSETPERLSPCGPGASIDKCKPGT